MKMTLIQWRKGDVRNYLDGEIEKVRAKSRRARSKQSKAVLAAREETLQSVREDVFGEQLPDES